MGKQENCRVAVSLSVATWSSSLPVGYRLYLPKEWAEDNRRREKTEVPEEVAFQTKPEMALDQIRAAVAVIATFHRPSTCVGEAVGDGPSLYRLQGDYVA